MGSSKSKESLVPTTTKDPTVKATRKPHVKRNKIPLKPTTTDRTIPSFMTPYIRNIENAIGDGNCGFRAVALSIGKPEHEWSNVRKELLMQLRKEFDYYSSIHLFKDCISEVSESFQWESGACYDKKHHMQMPVTAYILADLYKRPCVVFTQTGNHTYMPKNPPSEFSEENRPIVLLLDLPTKNGYESGHYKSVEVTDDCILPPILSQIATPFVEQWTSLFSQQLQAYSQIAVTVGIDSIETSLLENEVNVNKSDLVFQVDSPTSSMLVHNNDVAVADIKVIYKYGARSLPSVPKLVEKLDKNETTPSIPTTAVNLINGNNVYAKKLSKRAKLRAMMKRLVKKIAKAIANAVKPLPTVNFHFDMNDEDLHRYYKNNKCSLMYFIIVVSGM